MSMYGLYTFTYFWAQVSFIHTRPFTCTYCYAHIPLYILILLYIFTLLHTSIPLFRYMFIYYYLHIRPAYIHISVSPYAPHICLHTSTPINILLSIFSTTYLYILRSYYAHIPEHVHILRQTYTNITLHSYMSAYLQMFRYSYAHIRHTND
jgi:hypothetical protein